MQVNVMVKRTVDRNFVTDANGKWNAKSPMSHYKIEYDAKT